MILDVLRELTCNASYTSISFDNKLVGLTGKSMLMLTCESMQVLMTSARSNWKSILTLNIVPHW